MGGRNPAGSVSTSRPGLGLKRGPLAPMGLSHLSPVIMILYSKMLAGTSHVAGGCSAGLLSAVSSTQNILVTGNRLSAPDFIL